MLHVLRRVIALTRPVGIVGCLLLIQSSLAHPAGIAWEERVVAGGPDRFMMVRHVVVKGSNYEIGKKIGEILGKDGDAGPVPSQDTRRNRLQREYMAENYPIMYERMRGLADAFGLSIDDDAYDLSNVPQFHISGPGCSAVFYPGLFTESGHGIMSRNFDFTTGTIMGLRPEGAQLAALARPYIFEIYPDRGYASISVCAFELLGGVLDGINSEGLAVAIFADDEAASEVGLHPCQGIGLHELQSMRYLLDNCKDVGEAKDAMLYNKHYYSFVPCLYLVADRNGDSFVFEFAPLRNGTSIVDGDGIQCITNHPPSKYASVDDLPGDSQLSTYDRYRTLIRATEGKDGFGLDDIIAVNSSAAIPATASGNETYAPGRTLWHSIYDVDERSLRIKFYLGEGAADAGEGETTLEYSPYLEFKLAR